MGKLDIMPLEIRWPISEGYFPDLEQAKKLVEEKSAEVKKRYKYWKLYEFNGMSFGYSKCRGYGDHKACDEIVPSFGTITFKLTPTKKAKQ